jgi:hypothetical protein
MGWMHDQFFDGGWLWFFTRRRHVKPSLSGHAGLPICTQDIDALEQARTQYGLHEVTLVDQDCQLTSMCKVLGVPRGWMDAQMPENPTLNLR